ncbi:hypothetical protein bcgnr5390_16690 [Bacillus luti]|nr:hypothetical protein BC2903_53950 [Bacillus cereus]
MKRKLITIFCLSFALIPTKAAIAETYSYNLTIAQPILSVSINNSTTKYDQSVTLEKTTSDHLLTVDTISIGNTGTLDANIEARAVVTSKDPNNRIYVALGQNCSPKINEVGVHFIDKTTNTQIGPCIDGVPKVVTALQKGTNKQLDLNLKLHKDFQADVNLTLEINAKAN